jgi:hypothetical protein
MTPNKSRPFTFNTFIIILLSTVLLFVVSLFLNDHYKHVHIIKNDYYNLKYLLVGQSDENQKETYITDLYNKNVNDDNIKKILVEHSALELYNKIHSDNIISVYELRLLYLKINEIAIKEYKDGYLKESHHT